MPTISNLRILKHNVEEDYRKLCEEIISFRKIHSLEKYHWRLSDANIGTSVWSGAKNNYCVVFVFNDNNYVGFLVFKSIYRFF